MNPLQLRVVNSPEEAESLLEEGWCPVEASIGGRSFVDHLVMDHHGEHSHLEAVSIRAYKDHFGARADDPRFFTPAPVDADAAWATAALAGILPHPDAKVPEELPPHVKASLTYDWTALAETIAQVDVDPIGLDLTSMVRWSHLGIWNAMNGGNANTDLDYYTAVGLWVNLTTAPPHRLKPFVGAVLEAEDERVASAKRDLQYCRKTTWTSKVLVLNETTSWGFDVWYGRNQEGGGPEDVAGWTSPIVLARVKESEAITVGCPNRVIAEKLFGEGGLINLFGKLEPSGWGGREAVGGSPRGLVMTEAQLNDAAKVIVATVKEVCPSCDESWCLELNPAAACPSCGSEDHCEGCSRCRECLGLTGCSECGACEACVTERGQKLESTAAPDGAGIDVPGEGRILCNTCLVKAREEVTS